MDTSTPVGTWYLNANAYRLELRINFANNAYSGTIANEGAGAEPVDQISWDAAGRWLEFRRNGPGFFQWYRMCLTYGVLAGRFSHATIPQKPELPAYTLHVTGWSPDWIELGIVPRTWDVLINNAYHGVLRIDRDAGNALAGRLKMYLPAEELENDLAAITWDGTNLSFTRTGPGFTQAYTGKAHGRFISGSFTQNGGDSLPWTGTRAEVLGFGLGSRLPQRDAWQAAMRGRVVNLTEGMRLANIDIPPIHAADMGPVGPFLNGYPPERDDAPDSWPPKYTLRSLQFTVSPGSRFDSANPPPPRVFNGILATPNGPVPAGGFRPMVIVNGHSGSAQQCMTSSDEYFWYGESAARRDLIVLAIDIGHRPKWNWGPIVHPPIVDHGYIDSNWEEDGERAFSVRRAIDWFLVQPNVRQGHLFMAGLSLGGEVTTITTGLDPRIRMGLVAGFSPDMHVMDYHGNHPCYLWDYADIHEYLDVSDWEALTAPRPLVVETGETDPTFSGYTPPYASDKQLTRRARDAYGPDAANLVHYLHYDVHHFHVGDSNPTNPSRAKGVLEAAIIAPASPGDQGWQTDGSTVLRSPTLYNLMNEFLP